MATEPTATKGHEESQDITLPRPGILANLWWGVSRGVALACLPLLLRMFQGGYLSSRIPGTSSPGIGTSTDLAIFALGAGLGVVAGLLRPLARSFAGSLLFGVLLVQAGVWGLWYFVRRDPGAPDWHVAAAASGFGLLLGAAFYVSQQQERRRI